MCKTPFCCCLVAIGNVVGLTLMPKVPNNLHCTEENIGVRYSSGHTHSLTHTHLPTHSLTYPPTHTHTHPLTHTHTLTHSFPSVFSQVIIQQFSILHNRQSRTNVSNTSHQRVKTLPPSYLSLLLLSSQS